MDRTIAQSAPNNGASTAEDFQPTTRNPQGSVSDVQQQDSLENVTNPQEFLDQNKTVELSVAAEPAPVPPQNGSNNFTTLVIIASIAIVLAILLFKLSNKIPSKKPTVASKLTETKSNDEAIAGNTIKKSAVKSKSKKTKRRNR